MKAQEEKPLLVEITWTDANGKKHRRYSVRSLGPNQGFGVVDRMTNRVVLQNISTRGFAWSKVGNYTQDDLQ
jgi:hypothetical protein